MSVSVSYILTGHGWADCIVKIDGKQVSVSASYLSDALGELLRASANLLRGIDQQTVSFDEEPGEYRWRFTRIDDGRIQFKILWFNSLCGREPDEAGEPILDAICPLRSFASAVASTAQRILDEHGVEGYREKWIRHDFPADRLAEIRHLLNA